MNRIYLLLILFLFHSYLFGLAPQAIKKRQKDNVYPQLEIIKIDKEDMLPRNKSIPRTWDIDFDDSDDAIYRLILMLHIEKDRGNIKNYELPDFNEILLIGGTVIETEYTLRRLKNKLDIFPSVVHIVNPNPNALDRFKWYFEYNLQEIKQEFPYLKAVKFYPTFGKLIDKYLQPYDTNQSISLAFGGSVLQDDVMHYGDQIETVRSIWNVLSPGGVFSYYGDSKGFFKEDLMTLIKEEEFHFKDEKFDIYVKSLKLTDYQGLKSLSTSVKSA